MSCHDARQQHWRSSRCSAGDCVEVAAEPQSIMIRGSKDVDGPVVVVSRTEWAAFVAGVKAGDFDDLV